MNEAIETILNAKTFAVVGASTNTEKYGYKVWKMLREYGRTAYAINPRATEIEGEKAYPSLAALPEVPEAVVAIVPAAITETLPAQLAEQGIRYLWLQPGAESARAVAEATEKGIETVHGGPCIMVGLRTHFKRPVPSGA